MLKQAANDMIDGKMSSWQDYAMQAGIGGVTGVLQLVGIKGADKALKAITNTVGKYAAKYAIETATDTASDVLKQVFIEKKELSWQMLGSSAASSLLSNAGGDLLKGGFGKLGKKLDLDKVDNKLFKAGAEFTTDTIADTAIDVADNTLIKGEEFSLEMLGESAVTSALDNLAARGANKLYGDKIRSIGHDKSKVDNNTSKPKDLTDTSPEVDNNTSKPKDLTDKSPEVDNNTSKHKDLTDNDDNRNKQLTPERKAELEQKLENRKLTKEEWKELDRDRRISEKQNQTNSESSTPQKTNQDGNERTHHKDQPEIEPGIVAKEKTSDGHEIKVLKDGRIVRCSDCAEIRQKYKEQLEANSKLKKRLDEIEKIQDGKEKTTQATKLEEQLRLAEANDNLQKMREKYNLPDQPTIGVGKTDIPGLENKTFEGMSPALRQEAKLPSLDEAMPNREIKSPYSSPQFTRHAEEDILNQVHEKIKGLKLSNRDLEGKTLFLHIDNELGVCNKCAMGLLNPKSDKIGVVKQFSIQYPTLKIQITAKDADALIRSESKGGKITTLFVQDGKVIEN